MIRQKDELFLRDIIYEIEKVVSKSFQMEVRVAFREIIHKIENYLNNCLEEKIRMDMKRSKNTKITIPNAGQKFNIPFKEVIFTREEMKDIKPEYAEWVIKTTIKDYIHMRLNIERYFQDMADKCNLVLPNWNIRH